MLGALLSLISAAAFGLNNALLRRGVLGGSVLQAMAITVPAGVPLFALGCLLFGATGAVAGLTATAWGWYTAAGITHFIVGRYANYRATKVLGAAQAGPVIQLSLIISVFLALALLGEKLTVLQAVGIVLVFVGPLIVLRQRAGNRVVRTRAGQTINYVEGYFWGFVCALGFGSSPILIRFGLGSGGVIESLAGGFASYTAAALVFGAIVMAVPANRADVWRMKSEDARWFCAAGFLVFISQILLFMALSLAPVAVVTAVQRTALVFRVLFSWMINRDHEVIGPSVLTGVALSAAGVGLVTIDVDLIDNVVPLPAWFDRLPNLGWP
jgi:drug/metabolite transporter (DMT)-like permease